MRSPGTRRSRTRSGTFAPALVVMTVACWYGAASASAQDGEPPPGQEAPTEGDAAPDAVAPGAPNESGIEAVGWGGRRARVLRVEGASMFAPLEIDKKPRPQNDWFVQHFGAGVPSSLNSFATPESGAQQVAGRVLGRLVEVDPDHPPKVVPGLALSWEVADNGRTCTYRLRRGVQFADGRPFTSADVAFSFGTLRDPGVPADHLRASLEKVASIETPDAHTVVVKYKTRSWRAVYVVGTSLPILNRAWYEEQIPLWAEKLGLAKHSTTPGQSGFAEVFKAIRVPCPGTGPYYLRSEDDFTDRYVHLVQNPFSWQIQVRPRRHNFAGLRWIHLEDEKREYQAFVRGQLDVWVVPHATWENQLSRDVPTDAVGRHFVYDHIGLDCSIIGWNCRKPPFDDPVVRRAMTHLVDRERILWRLEQGHGTVASCRSKPSYATYSPDIEPHPFDVDKAKVLLTRAGWWQDADEDGFVEKDGEEFEFELTIPAGRPYFVEIGEQLQRACRKVGLNMAIRSVDPAQFAREIRDRKFQAVAGFSSWPDPWIDLYSGYHSSQATRRGSNVSGWKHSEADKLLEAMQQEADDAERTKMHHAFNRIFHEEQPETLLVHSKVGVLINKRFENVSVRPTGLQSFDLWVRPENVVHREPETPEGVAQPK